MLKRNFGKIFLVACLGFVFNGMVYGQGVYEAWLARYNGPGNSGDIARALAVDDSGYIYVTGGSVGSGSIQDYVTIKYKPNGDTSWVRRYNGPAYHDDGAYAIAVDDSGFVYVTGQSLGVGTAYDYATIKYRPNGDTAWLRRYNGLGNSSDAASAVVVDNIGNVYVTGMSVGSGTGADYATIKYAPNGDTLWVRRYNGPGNWDDKATALAQDALGNVYVTGESGPYPDYVTIKYASSGDTLWVRRYNGPIDGADVACSIVLDASDNIYVTGYSSGATSYDYATVKYAPNGDTLWIRRYDGPGNSYEQATALALDTLGNVYVTGYSWSGTSGDYATIKYAPNGDTLWIRRYNGPANGEDWAIALAVDDSGYVYVTGFTSDLYTDADYATIKYGPNGDTLWVRRYNGPGNGGDEAKALAVDGNVYVTGYSKGSGTDFDFGTIKYSPCSSIPGDVNSNGDITLGDIIHIVNYIFDKDKLPCLGTDPGNCWTPDPFCRGDVNISGAISLGDIIHLVNYVFDKDKLPCLGIDPGNCWTPEANGACCLAVP